MRRVPVGWLAPLLLVGSLAPPAAAQAVNTQQNQTITIRGILSGTLYAQDANFGLGNGQKAQFVATERDDWVFGGDVRNMRLTLGINGPEVGRGWRANGTFEIDFFGPFVGGGNFSDEQPEPRLRLAYVDLTNGRTTVRVGQAWSLTLGNIPVSTSHIGFPLGWGPGGFIGWRFPGVWFQTTLSRANAPTTTRLWLAVMRGSWQDEGTPGTDDNFSAGERSAPQLEGRLEFSARNWGAYLVGHVDSKDSINAAGDDLTSWAVEGGYRLTRGDLTLHGNVHVGRGMGHHFAQIVQFGDIQGWGGWVQAGYNLSPRWSLWGFVGYEQPNEDDVRAAVPLANTPRLKSLLVVPMLRYASGPYSVGLEWLYNTTTVATGATTEEDRKGNQILASVRYDF
ncbi:MAG TPA: hypothetical protein VNI61_02870 [Gemmatimonadales bacterium]|nr:hypothetical protein [Gemmatimonadales bacterium]